MDSKRRHDAYHRKMLSIWFSGVFLFLFCISISLTADAAQVSVYPGQNIQGLVNQYSGGTTFLLTPGVYRLQSVVPKDYDSFVGQPGAVLDGAELVTSFSKSGSYWTAHVQGVIQQSSYRGVCDSNHPACALPQDLFYNSVPKRRVLSLSALGPGKWYLDYSTATVYVDDDPTGSTVELSVLPQAFSGSAQGVHISQLTIEKYACVAGAGAVNGSTGLDWTVEWSTLRLNHGMGIRIGNGMWVYHNHLDENGQMGLGGSGQNVLVEDNEIGWNNFDGFSFDWEAGGSKFSFCYNLIIRGNDSHNNYGPGLWTDINNQNTTYEYNQTSANKEAGIKHEISYSAVIRYNTIENDGYNAPGLTSMWYGAGIVIAESSGVTVYGNTIKNCMNGIAGIQTYRGNGPNGQPYLLQDLSVYGNTITQSTGQAEGIVRSIAYDNSVYTSWGNHFQNDTYNLSDPTGLYFVWYEKLWTLAWWGANAGLH